MPEAVIVDAVRTPIGALGGSLAAVRPDDLAAHVLKTLVEADRNRSRADRGSLFGLREWGRRG